MNLAQIKKKELERIKPDDISVKNIKKIVEGFSEELKKQLMAQGHEPQIFVGGSFAKGTLIKKDKYDVDLFVRFDWRYDNISEALEKALKKVCMKLKIGYEKIHGSRDYFRVYSGENFYIEVVPVAKISRPQGARNVTDLSYFHVAYVKRKIKGLENEAIIAKRFLQAQKVYGAESYVHGFSGYAVECLIVYYKKFEKMLSSLAKAKPEKRLVIDLEKHYKKNEVFFDMNESKLHSPVILVDPTFKERNALASLSHETFERFQKAARAFLKKPSLKFFADREIDTEALNKKAKKIKGEFVKLKISTDRQEGDIAGTKLRKFHYFMMGEMKKYFKIISEEFEYSGKKSAYVFLVVKSLGEIERIGPPLKYNGKKEKKFMEKHIEAFREQHKNAYEKSGYLRAKIKVDFTAREFLEDWAKKNKAKMNEMGVVGMRVLS